MTVGWGLGAYGLTPWGGGGGPPAGGFAIVGADPVNETTVRVALSEQPYSDGVGSVADALDESHWTVTLVAGGVGLDGQPVRAVSAVLASLVPGTPTCVDVTVDRPFSPYPCRYAVSATGLRAMLSGLPLAPGYTSATFHGLLRTVESASRDLAMRNRDVGSPQTPGAAMDPLPDPLGAILGSFNPDATGDYAYDEGLTGYRKRILRRIFCRKRRFIFLPPTWGLGIADNIKRQNTPSGREAIRSDMEAQILAEPDTASCTVTTLLSHLSPNIVRFKIQASTRTGLQLNTTLPLVVG